MNRKNAPYSTSQPFPSTSEVLAFISRERTEAAKAGRAPPKIGKREIARAFGLKGSSRIALKSMLKELEGDGAIERNGKSLRRPGALPEVVVADIQSRDPDGELMASPVEWDAEAHGPPPRILILTSKGFRSRREPASGIGDRVLLRILGPAEDSDATFTGRVIKRLDKTRSRSIGVFRANPQGGGRVLPVDKKNLGEIIAIPRGLEGGARDGDLVAVEKKKGPRASLSATVAECLGPVDSEKQISLIAIHRHGVPHLFGSAALAEAEAAAPVSLANREDWRDAPLVTIDPADARDHDDAVFALRDPAPSNEGGYILTVAIADVSAYVRAGGALDREALERGNSVYFPGRVVPMLPERISNDLCSLREGQDRPALAVRMTIDREGRKLRHSFHRVMMRSAAKLTYEQAQAAIDGAHNAVATEVLNGALRPLWEAYAALRTARERRSPLDLDLPERKIILNEAGGVDRVIVPARLDAHRLIEEFMILANVAAAESLEDKRHPLIYRVHDEPTQEKVRNLSDFLSSLGLKLAKGQVLQPAHFNAILNRATGTPHETLVNESILRAQAQAEYAVRNLGHFGLRLRRYAHFTSPIRRYADLTVHRALINALGLGADGRDVWELERMDEVAARISAAERRAVAAERETVDRLIATWLSDQIGASFQGRVSGVTKSGLFVKLEETGADGFIPASTLGSDYFRFDERRRALVAHRSRQAYQLGDIVQVKLVEATPLAGALRFELTGEERPGKPARVGATCDTASPSRKGASRSFDTSKSRRRR